MGFETTSTDSTTNLNCYANMQINMFFVDSIPKGCSRTMGKQIISSPTKSPCSCFPEYGMLIYDWEKRGGLEKTDWKKASFVSSYKDFGVDDPYPTCFSITTQNCGINILLGISRILKKNLVIYDYCKNYEIKVPHIASREFIESMGLMSKVIRKFVF
ncbi:putative xyloglucan endotransglucosylase/hydrolase protein 8 [Quercus suber]|uniref:Xyloglucan endotransglucosylase/hydrolase protein 8 n=1 Tax=Quercus suber TaxID=58331 RepID=A0AAW0IP78_QUESU